MELRDTIKRVAGSMMTHYPEATLGLIRFANNHFSSPDQDESVPKHALFEKAEYAGLAFGQSKHDSDKMTLTGFYSVMIEAGIYKEFLRWKR